MKEKNGSADGQSTIVQVLNGTVFHAGQVVALSTHERQIAVALALQTHPVPSEFLCDLLYPDRDYERVRTLLKVYVCRLRRRVAPDFIVRDSRGYALGPNVRIDAQEFGPLIDEVLRRRAVLNPAQRRRIEEVARRLRGDRPAFLLTYEWYTTASQRLERQGRDIIIALSEDAIGRGDFAEAVRLTRDLIYEDTCDEAAREIAIRAHLKAGDQGAALQEFRMYRKALAYELQARPSRELVAMIQAAAT